MILHDVTGTAAGSLRSPPAIPLGFAACLLAMGLVIAGYREGIFFSAALLVATLLFAIYYFRPVVGVYLLLLVFPLQSILIWMTVGLPVRIKLHFFEPLAPIILAALAARRLADHGRELRPADPPISASVSHLIFYSAAFVCWSALTLFWARDPEKVLFGWWRMNCNVVFAAFLIACLRDYKVLVRTLMAYCGLAAFFAGIAIYSNTYGFYSWHNLLRIPSLFIDLESYLMVYGAGYNPTLVGMAHSSGLSNKHELGIYLSCAIIFCLFLFTQFRSVLTRTLLVVLIFLNATAIHMAFSKAAVVGLSLTVTGFCLVVPAWRRLLPALVPGILAFWFIAGSLSSSLKPEYHSRVSTFHKIAVVADQGAYGPGTFAARLRLMGSAVDMIRSTNGLGAGPDSLERLKTEVFHGHNFLLTFMADYGLPGAILVLAILGTVGSLAYARLFRNPRTEEPIWLLRCSLFACLIVSLIEYSVDCFIWYPHLWIMCALLLASLRISAREGARALEQGLMTTQSG